MKQGDIVTLVVDGQEYDAEVEKTYEDQDYVDVRVVSGGPNAGVAHQTVGPKPKEGESLKYFEKKTAAEQKALREGAEDRTEDAPPPGTQPAGTLVPDKPEDLAPGAKARQK